jgi:putative acetyltransferase
MIIREANNNELATALQVESAAFDGDEEIARLVTDLANDPGAEPLLSLLAFADDQAAGHIMFSAASIENQSSLKACILAPLAVVPGYQRRGIGGALIKSGLEIQTGRGVDMVFVLGYPEYYSRHGFMPAGAAGFKAPYPIPPENADAWMVQELRPGIIGSFKGRVICCGKLDRPEYWRE